MTRTVTVSEAQQCFDELLDQALAGDEIIITEGTLAVKLVPVVTDSDQTLSG